MKDFMIETWLIACNPDLDMPKKGSELRWGMTSKKRSADQRPSRYKK